MLHLNNTLRPKQSGRQFPDDIFKCFFFLISIRILLKFVAKGPIAIIPSLPIRQQAIIWTNDG